MQCYVEYLCINSKHDKLNDINIFKHSPMVQWCGVSAERCRWPQFRIELGLGLLGLGLEQLGLVVGDAVLGALGQGAELQRPWPVGHRYV